MTDSYKQKYADWGAEEQAAKDKANAGGFQWTKCWLSTTSGQTTCDFENLGKYQNVVRKGGCPTFKEQNKCCK